MKNAVNTRVGRSRSKAVVGSRPSWCGVMLGSLITSWLVSGRDRDGPARVAARGGELDERVPPRRCRRHPAGEGSSVAERAVRVSQRAPVAETVPDVAPLFAAATTVDGLRRVARCCGARTPGALTHRPAGAATECSRCRAA